MRYNPEISLLLNIKVNLNKLPQDSIIYFGGTLHPPDTFKNKTWSHAKTIRNFKKGINKINPEKFRILGGNPGASNP